METEKPRANTKLDGERLAAFSKVVNKKRVFPPTQPCARGPIGAIKREKERKSTQIGKKEVKLPVFAGDMVLYVENPEEFAEKPLELITELGKVAGTRSTHKNQLCFYTPAMNKLERKLGDKSHL